MKQKPNTPPPLQLSLTETNRAKATIGLWQSPRKSPPSTGSEHSAQLSQQLQLFQANTIQTLQSVQDKVASVDRRLERNDKTIAELQDAISRSSEEVVGYRGEGKFFQQQLEALTIAHEQDRFAMADHTEQLQYLTTEVRMWRESAMNPKEATYWALAGWVYVPLLLLIKGLWVLLSPFIATFTNLSLFSSKATATDWKTHGKPVPGRTMSRHDAERFVPAGGLLNVLLQESDPLRREE